MCSPWRLAFSRQHESLESPAGRRARARFHTCGWGHGACLVLTRNASEFAFRGDQAQSCCKPSRTDVHVNSSSRSWRQTFRSESLGRKELQAGALGNTAALQRAAGPVALFSPRPS